jgi:hypothetical protein
MATFTKKSWLFPAETQKVTLSEYRNHFRDIEKYSENMTVSEHKTEIEEWLKKQ